MREVESCEADRRAQLGQFVLDIGHRELILDGTRADQS